MAADFVLDRNAVTGGASLPGALEAGALVLANPLIAGRKKIPADPHSNASCAAQVQGNVRVLRDFMDTRAEVGLTKPPRTPRRSKSIAPAENAEVTEEGLRVRESVETGDKVSFSWPACVD